MKKLIGITLAVAMVLTLVLVPATSVGASPAAAIEGLWHLDDNALDYSGNGNHGTITGNVTYVDNDMSSDFGKAATFDGGGDYIDCGTTNLPSGNSSMTLEAWMKTSASKGQAAFIFGDPTIHQAIYISIYNGQPLFGIWGGYPNVWGSAGYDDGEWHHIVGVSELSGSTNTLSLYVDGAYVAQGTTTSQNIVLTTCVIGADVQATRAQEFNGLIDEVRIWSSVYSDFEVSASPTSDYNGVTLGHEITATVDPVAPGVTVGLEVTSGPNVTDTDSGQTDASGEVTLSYTSDGTAGTDTIRIWVDRNWNGTYDDTVDYTTEVTKDWVTLVSLTPEIDFNPVDTEHTVQATISSAVPGVEVWFQVYDNNSAGGSSLTNASGVATFSYTGTSAGRDWIRAYFDTNGNDQYDYDPDEPRTDKVMKYYLENFVTGGGNIKDSKKPAWTFAGTVGNLENGSVGQYQIVDHAGKVSYHCNNNFSSVVFSGEPIEGPPGPDASNNTAIFTGTFTNNRDDSTVDLTITIVDVDEPGKEADTIGITVSSGNLVELSTLPASSPIDGGNFQVHNIPPVVY